MDLKRSKATFLGMLNIFLYKTGKYKSVSMMVMRMTTMMMMRMMRMTTVMMMRRRIMKKMTMMIRRMIMRMMRMMRC